MHLELKIASYKIKTNQVFKILIDTLRKPIRPKQIKNKKCFKKIFRSNFSRNLLKVTKKQQSLFSILHFVQQQMKV